MPEFDSLSFALLIPFAICFALIFVVCCFADEIKDICRLPSPLPSSYLAAEHLHYTRQRNRRQMRQSRPPNEEIRNLILSEEGRSRNVSESSIEHMTASNMLAHSSTNMNYGGQARVQLHQNLNLLPQTTIPNGNQRSGIPNRNCIVLQPGVHCTTAAHCNVKPSAGVLNTQNKTDNTVNNYNRNLALHAGMSVKDIHSCVGQLQKPNDSDEHKHSKADLNKYMSVPHTLNHYLSGVTPHSNSSLSLPTSSTETGDESQQATRTGEDVQTTNTGRLS